MPVAEPDGAEWSWARSIVASMQRSAWNADRIEPDKKHRAQPIRELGPSLGVPIVGWLKLGWLRVALKRPDGPTS